MENLNIRTTQNIDIVQNIAGVGNRIVASILDLLFMGCYLIVIMGFLSFIGVNNPAIIIFFYLPVFFYHIVCEALFNGQSLGKYIMKLRVVMLDGTQPVFSAFLLRWIFRLLDTSFSFGIVGIMTVILNGKGQRIGDIAAGTTVIKLKPPIQLNSFFYKIDDTYKITYPSVELLNENDINIIREVLRHCHENPQSPSSQNLLSKTSASLVKRLNVSDLKQTPYHFIQTVIKDYTVIITKGIEMG